MAKRMEDVEEWRRGWGRTFSYYEALTNRRLLVVLVLFSSVYFLHCNMFNTAKSNALLV